MTPPASAQSMIAMGILRRGSSVSSERVEMASKPRKDRARIAAPAITLPTFVPES